MRAAADWPLEALEALTSNAVFAKDLVETILIAVAVQEFDVGLADDNVIGRRVVVQFLMPLLEEMPGHLFEVVAMHDIEDFVTDALAFAAAADCGQAQTGKRARSRFTAKDFCKFLSQAILGMGEFARLGVVVALPGELANG